MTLLRPTFTAGHRVEGWSNDDYAVMRQTIYQLLRDTGRRPGEITALRRDCLDTDPGGGPVLIYTNAKATDSGADCTSPPLPRRRSAPGWRG